MGWPALVVGHRGSGKTSIIQGLAAGVGAKLTEVCMTPSVDVTELLGCFEQVRASNMELLHEVYHQEYFCSFKCSFHPGRFWLRCSVCKVCVVAISNTKWLPL